MYPIGHIGLGIIVGMIFGHFFKEQINLYFIIIFSIIPDIDIVIPFVHHRGPLHSIFILSILYVPIYAIIRQKTYYFVLISHLLGDVITSYGVQLFYPISNDFVKIPNALIMPSLNELFLEITILLIAVLMLMKYNKNKIICHKIS